MKIIVHAINVYQGCGQKLLTSFLEAILTGSFPIKSCKAFANEWIVHGKTGMIVSPEDLNAIEKSIRLALVNDSLVDNAAILN